MPYPSHFKRRLYIRKNSQWNPESIPLFFKWLVNVVYGKKQSHSVMWKLAWIYYFYFILFLLLCLPREKLHWVLQVLGSLTSIKRTVERLGGVGCVGSRMKNYSPVVVDVVRELKQQMWSLLSHSLCLEKSFVHPKFIE